MSDVVKKIIRYCRKKNVRVCRHYSGRGMFGKCCIGIVGARRECTPIAETIRKKTGQEYCFDQLGMSMVFYFPGIADDYPNRSDNPSEE